MPKQTATKPETMLQSFREFVRSCSGFVRSVRSMKSAIRLSWEGKVDTRLAEVRALPEPIWQQSERGAVWAGDNADMMASLAVKGAGTVTLAYLDPPFLTQRSFQTSARAAKGVETAFDDRWSSRAEYLQTLGDRLRLVKELLAPWGSVVIHVDPKTSHYVRVLADEIFGEDNFVSEIIWRYRRWPSKQPNFQRVHDVLLRYRKDMSVPGRWNQLYEPLAASTQATWGDRKQLASYDGSGHRVRSVSTKDVSPGVPMGDVWEIGVIAPVSKERTGYPSQKPEALLERLITALSDPGDLVLDPYAGSGTTLRVADKTGRRFWGIDASPVALRTLAARLDAHAAPPASESRLKAAAPRRERLKKVG